MKILKLTKSNRRKIISDAVQVLKQSGILIYPTETCYGVGVDATSQPAVDKVLEYKTRREGKPLSIAVSGLDMARKYVKINDIALNLYNQFLPGPLTVVSKSLGCVAKGVESEESNLGIRYPDYDLILEIVENFGKPITATSANASYKKRPYKINDILENISKKQKDLIGLIIDAGELPHNDPSTVADTTLNAKVVLRQGNLKLTKKLQKQSKKPEDTQKLGFEIMNKYKQYLGYKSVVFAMKGELGAGKTEMTKGVARALDIEDSITSPTFIIENNYQIPAVENSYLSQKDVELIHIDVWRLHNSKELEDLNFFKQIGEGNVFVIEWADKVIDILKKVTSDAIILWVDIEYGKARNERKITISDFN
ncbi:threonylcarbamoyl-AMP synthase [Candidatus Dojkabacteria bacterium]|nr:threonylcarbamoyl-AMP synthase [Candidatus Dojkabacteria bacterium]